MDSSHTTHASGGGKEHSKPGHRVEKKTKYKGKMYGRCNRHRGFPNYGKSSSSKYEVLIKPGFNGEASDGMEEGEDEQAPHIQPAKFTNTNAKFSGPRTLAEPRKRHDELAEWIKNTKKGIASYKESVAKEAARKAVQKAKLARTKQEQEATEVKDVETKLEEMYISFN
jgi:hypothetical protein